MRLHVFLSTLNAMRYLRKCYGRIFNVKKV